MKKFGIIFVAIMTAIVATSVSSCGNGTPKANLKSELDTFSYAIGVAQTQGLKEYLTQAMGVDTSYIDEIVAGINDAVKSGENKKKAAYYGGYQIGQQITQQMIKTINYKLFGEDSTQTISQSNFIAGFIAGTTNKNTLMALDSAAQIAETKMTEIKERVTAEAYAENKKACEEFMANIAQKEGVKALDNGVYYEVITEGKGAIPTEESRVKVHYEGKLINDTIFDSSYEREQPATFRTSQVIPGWVNVLTHMPVGSKWIVYIPQEQAYGSRDTGRIPPYSCLIFTIDLLSIEE